MTDEFLKQITYNTYIPKYSLCAYCEKNANHMVISIPITGLQALHDSLETVCRRHIENHLSWKAKNGYKAKAYCMKFLNNMVENLKREHYLSLSIGGTKHGWAPTWRIYNNTYTMSSDLDGTWHVTTYTT